MDYPVIFFDSPKKWEQWLAKNHAKSKGLWMRIYKIDSGKNSITYGEALDGALCYGWIDGQKKKYDEKSWIQKFTPRGPKSSWSKINTKHVERLTKEGRMQPAGLAAVESAKKDGRWDKAYDSQKSAAMPLDFLEKLEDLPIAKEFFLTLNKANRYAIAYRLQTAKKPETREKRMRLILEMLQEGKTFH